MDIPEKFNEDATKFVLVSSLNREISVLEKEISRLRSLIGEKPCSPIKPHEPVPQLKKRVTMLVKTDDPFNEEIVRFFTDNGFVHTECDVDQDDLDTDEEFTEYTFSEPDPSFKEQYRKFEANNAVWGEEFSLYRKNMDLWLKNYQDIERKVSGIKEVISTYRSMVRKAMNE